MGGPKVRLHSRIQDDLPEEIRKEVNRLLVTESYTYDEIAEYLKNKGYSISRSAIGRHGKRYFAEYRQMQIMEDQARIMISETGDGMILEEAVAKTFAKQLLELLHSGKLDLKKAPKIIGEFARLQASTVLRERVKSEYAKKAAKAADDVASALKTSGLTDEKAAEIRKKILGIAA